VEYRGAGASVRQMPVDGAGRGETVLELRADTDAAVVAVSAMAPLTLQQARYTIDFAPTSQ
jgi:hypothetical protein